MNGKKYFLKLRHKFENQNMTMIRQDYFIQMPIKPKKMTNVRKKIHFK